MNIDDLGPHDACWVTHLKLQSCSHLDSHTHTHTDTHTNTQSDTYPPIRKKPPKNGLTFNMCANALVLFLLSERMWMWARLNDSHTPFYTSLNRTGWCCFIAGGCKAQALKFIAVNDKSSGGQYFVSLIRSPVIPYSRDIWRSLPLPNRPGTFHGNRTLILAFRVFGTVYHLFIKI